MTDEMTGPDLSDGIASRDVVEGGMLLGHAAGEAVLLVRRHGDVLAVGAKCTHYGGPLNEGILVGDTIRCPWHHAAFNIHTGEPDRPPARHPISCWHVEEHDGRVRVLGRKEPAAKPSSVVILGAGAAGAMAAETLRKEGYEGPVTVVEAGMSPPYDRPNVSKDYLAGTAPEEWMPLRPDAFYADHGITLLLGRQATTIDTALREVSLEDGTVLPFGALLIASGAEPIRLPVPDPHGRVRYLRSLEDGRALIQHADKSQTAIVVGASFIGLEVAASLRARGLAVTVVAPEKVPFERVLGPELGEFVRALHEEHGVAFRLGETVASVHDSGVTLGSGDELAADLVVAGIGVRPRTDLADRAGIRTDRGILVDEFLRTSVPGIYAAGDVARWHDRQRNEHIRLEHWVVAQRQGETAARNMLGRAARFEAVPFFWSQHYDVTIAYVGYAPEWDSTIVAGDIRARDCTVTYRHGGRVRAVASIFRDKESLASELAMERAVAQGE